MRDINFRSLPLGNFVCCFWVTNLQRLNQRWFIYHCWHLPDMEPKESGYDLQFRHKRRNLTIAVVLVIIIVSGFFVVTGEQAQNTVNVMWLRIDIHYPPGSDYFGPSVRYVQENVHTLQSSSTHSFSFVIRNSGTTSHSIVSVAINTPGFSLVSVQNGLPITISPGGSATVVFTVMTPPDNFQGNLNVSLVP